MTQKFSTFKYDGDLVERTHDKFYLNENRKENPKEYFKFISAIARDVVVRPSAEIAEVGCATGDFAYYLRTVYPSIRLSAFDIDEELLERARQEVSGVTFDLINIAQQSLNKRYDAVFMNGVHSIFDDLGWLDNLLASVKPGGSLFVFGLFNPEDLDVMIKSRASCTSGAWETGWNVFSRKTVANAVTAAGGQVQFHDFKIEIDLPKVSQDPLRSWTEQLATGERLIRNGLQLVNTLSLMEVTVGATDR